MGNDISAGHSWDETTLGKRVDSDNLNRAFSDATIKETAISARTAKDPVTLSDLLLISDGALKKATLQSLATLLTANPDAKIITDRTAESAIVGDDVFLVYDASASALRKCTRDELVTAGSVIQTVQTSLTAVTVVTAAIPFDNTKPQISEGTQILSQAITPKTATNNVICRVSVPVATDSGVNVTVALFKTGNSDALASRLINSANSGTASFEFLDSPASASAQTYSVRVGNTDGLSSVGVCGTPLSSATRLHGGSNMATLTLQEIKA